MLYIYRKFRRSLLHHSRPRGLGAGVRICRLPVGARVVAGEALGHQPFFLVLLLVMVVMVVMVVMMVAV